MKKHLHPDGSAFAKRVLFFAITILMSSFFNRSLAQCVVASETNPNQINPSGCNNGSISLGAGAFFNLTVNANTYYNFSWSSNSAFVNGFCAQTLNGTAVPASFSTNQVGWFSATTTSLRISAQGDGSGNWDGVSAVMTYRYTTPTASASATPNPVCQGNNLSLTSTSTNAFALSWTGPNTFSASGQNTSVNNIQSAGAGVYVFTANNSGCTATASTASVVVNTAAVVNAAGPDVVCQSASPTAITLSGATVTGGGTTAAWSITSGGGSLSSVAQTTTPASVTYTPAANFSGTVTLTLTSNDPDGAGPCGPVTATRTITVSPAATATAGGPNSICENSGALTLTGASVGGSATTGAWSISSGGGSLSSTSQTASPATVTYTPAANYSGPVTLLLTTNNPGGGCGAASATRTITVTLGATATAGGPDVTCESASPSAITLAGSSVGGGATTGAWSISSGGGSLSSVAQTGSPNTVTYTPAANFSGTATLTLTTNSPGGGCSAVTATRTITINQFSTANAGGPDGICQSATPGALTLAGASVGGAATTGAWSISSGGGSLSSTSQTATPGTVTYTPVANFTGTVTLLLTTLDPDGAGPCIAATSTRTIIVSPSATATAGGPDVVCQSATPAAITLAGSSVGGAASTGAWSISSGGGTLSSTAQTGTPAAETYTPAANFSGIVTLILTTNNPGGACSAATDTRTITVNASPAVAPTSNSPVCTGFQINLNANASGGTPAYSYSWTGPNAYTSGSASPTLTNSDVTMSGAYDVTVTDQNTCTASGTTNVTVNPLPQGNISGTTSVCNGSSAQITFNFTAGTGTFDIVYTDGTTNFPLTGVNNGDFVSVSPSSIGVTIYSFVSITDANGCVRNSGFGGGAAITVTPLPVINSVVETDVLCNGGSTGTITVNASNGTAPLGYSIDNGGSFQSNFFFGGLPQGSGYNVVVNDAQGCVATYAFNPVTINEPTPLTQADSLVNASCANVFDGKITVYAAGGVTPYQYSLNGGPSQSGNAFTGVSAGTYAVAVIDAKGCINSVNVTIGNSYIVSDSILSQTNVSCFGGSDGAVTVQITGGTPPYVYSINGTIFQSSPTFTGLTAGNYVVTLRDSRGCTDFLPVTISQQPQLSANIDSVSEVSCNGTANGTIYLGVTGGTPGYTFNWSNGETSQNDINLGAGTYTVTIQDSKSCATFASATVTQPLTLFVNVASFHNLKCFNDSSGSIILSVNGGVPGYTFLWSNSATTQDLNNIGAGNYTGTITDANGCSQVVSQLITEPNQLTSSVLDTNVSCNGGSNGAIGLTVNGGTTAYSYLWSNGATTQNLSGIVAGNYTVVITDAHGCVISNSTIVTQPNALVLATTVTNNSCNGDSSGAVNLTVTGGTLNYSFAWSDGETVQSIGNLPAGSYTVTVTDGNACTASASATVTQSPPLIFTGSTVNDVTCNGAANGSIDVTVAGGTSPYTFTWDNGVFTANNTGLSGGIYNLTVTDNHSCSISAAFLINEPDPMVDTISSTNVTCHGAANGTTSLSVGGGTAPYTYLWSTFQNSQNLTGLNGGTYFVIITDANGCTKRDSVIITEPSALTLSISVVNVACSGNSTGSVNLTVTGGTPNYVYSWNTGPTTQNLSGVGAGTYIVTVTDSSGCVAVDSATVTQSSAMVLNATTVNVACAGGHNGSIALTVNGGVFPYTYAWSNLATTQNLNGLNGGTYSVTVQDANLCSITASYTITEPLAITTTVTGTNVTCHGQASGTASVAVGGGSSPYSFYWNTGNTTQSLSGLSGGTYFVVVTDANGCTKSDSVVITEPAAIVLTLTPTNVLCNGNATGGINLTVTGGVPVIIYNWSDNSHNQNLSGVGAGTYTITVIDGNACTASGSATITQPSAMVLNATTVNVACAGGHNGSIDLTVNGGVFPYTYAWSNLATTQNLNGLNGGIYSVTVQDANLCSITASYTITEPGAITITVTGTNVTCHGQANGTATVAVNGGSLPYSFHWNTGNTTQSLSGLSGGTYFVVVTDANGCSKSDSVVITEPGAIVLTLTPTNVLCNGNTTGGINLTVTGGVPVIIYNWSDNSHNQNLSGVGAGTYTVTVIDGNACTASGSATITQPSAMVLNATTVDVACAGGHNGSIALTVNGGVFPYTYAWSNLATTQNLNGLNGGTYSVTVQDANLCSITASYTITEPQPISSQVTGTNASCHGASNGTATLTVSGGTGPYSFLWSNFHATQNLSGLSGGTYFVIITDANGCTKRDSVIITEPSAIVVTATVINASCNGSATGSINLTVSGGSPGYTYSWSNGATTQNLTNVVAGTYKVTVTDSHGCFVLDSATITEPGVLVVTGTQQNVHCAGSSDGSIDLIVTGGTSPYQFIWSNSATTQNVTGLAVGTYTVTTSDANACSVTSSFTITAPNTISSNVAGTNVTCNGTQNGTATLTVSGGTSPYQFLWSNFQTTQNLANLAGGTYFVLITDASGCTKRDSVIIFEPSQIFVSDSVTNISCFNVNDGSIYLTVTGGNQVYTFHWNDGVSTQNRIGLTGGQYGVTVTDGSGCSASASATIINPSELITNFVVHNVLCYGQSNGSIDVIQSGGTPNYTFLWSNSATTQDISNLDSGVYSLTVTDSRGCPNIASAVVTEPGFLYATGEIKNVSCHGFNDGAVITVAYGGTLPYSYVWSNGQTTKDLYSVGGGAYLLTVTDANGCQVVSPYSVTDPTQLTDVMVATNVSCFGGSNGTVAVIPSGGTGVATNTYTYLWSNFVTDSALAGLAAGKYVIQLSDSNGCKLYDSVTLTQPTEILITGLVNDASCFNTPTGSVATTVTGGTPAYNFSWSNGGTSQNINTVSAGPYTITVTDSLGCQKSATFVIGQPTQMFLSVLTDEPSCHGSNNGSLAVAATGATPPYTYVWSTTPSQNTSTASGLSAGTYTVTVSDNKGCTVTASQVLNQPDLIVVTTNVDSAKCFNTASGQVVATATGGQSPYVFDLNGIIQPTGTFTSLLPGNYLVIATDINGCSGNDSFQIAAPGQIAVTLITTDQFILTGMQTQLIATATPASAAVEYQWSPITVDSADVFDYRNCSDTANCNQPYVSPPFSTTFTVTVYDANHCAASDTVTVYVSNQKSLFVPTAFTPNGDGLNDRFTFDILGATTIDISIFDRWGENIYHDPAQANGMSNSYGWDGTVHGKLSPEDTYVYQMKVTYFDGTVKNVTGTITLMR